MAAELPTNLGVHYAKNVLRKFYGISIAPKICNQNWEGTLKGGGADRVKILQFLEDVTLSDYDERADMSTQTWMGDTETSLTLDHKKYYNFGIDDLARFEAYVNDLDSALIENAAGKLQQTIDSHVLWVAWNGAKVGHRLGSDHKRASCYVSAAGAVEAAQTAGTAGPAFDAKDIGMGISFDDGTTWYRISAVTDSTSITIQDWNGSTYSGGAQTDKTPRIECQDVLTLTSSTVYGKICKLAQYLDEDDIPRDNRWLVVSPAIGGMLRQASELIPAVASAYEKVVEHGLLGYISGFKIYESNQVDGNSSTGWYCPAGHKSFCAFAHAFTKSRILEAEDRFSHKYQGLNVWGAIVPIERRKAGALLFAKV